MRSKYKKFRKEVSKIRKNLPKPFSFFVFHVVFPFSVSQLSSSRITHEIAAGPPSPLSSPIIVSQSLPRHRQSPPRNSGNKSHKSRPFSH